MFTSFANFFPTVERWHRCMHNNKPKWTVIKILWAKMTYNWPISLVKRTLLDWLWFLINVIQKPLQSNKHFFNLKKDEFSFMSLGRNIRKVSMVSKLYLNILLITQISKGPRKKWYFMVKGSIHSNEGSCDFF